MKMTLGGLDPAAEASKKGRSPTLGEVQKSLKVCNELASRIYTCAEWVVVGYNFVAIDQNTYTSNDSYGDSPKYVQVSFFFASVISKAV
jgi:hypothetical protein